MQYAIHEFVAPQKFVETAFDQQEAERRCIKLYFDSDRRKSYFYKEATK